MSQSPGLFRLPLPENKRPFLTLPIQAIEAVCGLPAVRGIYDHASAVRSGHHFFQDILTSMNVRLDVRPDDLAQIPATGAAVVVANHPFGGIEGIALGALIHAIRPDVKIMANYLLQSIPELAGSFIPVDPFGGASSARHNLQGIKQTLRHLAAGGIVVVFPAGEVSSYSPAERAITDSEWSTSIARIIRHAECAVVPVYIAGHNRMRFHVAGFLHPRLRTAMLPREFAHCRNSTLELAIGSVVAYQKLQEYHDAAMMSFLRNRVYILRHRRQHGQAPAERLDGLQSAISPAEQPEYLAAEVEQIPREQLLCASGDTFVFYTSAEQTPTIIREIGRLRELTFRAAGEGTGKHSDLDEFDAYYTHLFLWNAARQEIMGAYRLGKTDEILEKFGRKGLYIHTLFKIRKKFLRKISPALELGRSFIRAEYQKSSALLLLWRGIGQFIVRHPQYTTLFGAVSISNDYQTESRQMLMAYLETHAFSPKHAKFIKPRNSMDSAPGGSLPAKMGSSCPSVEQLSQLIAEIEPDAKGVPTLVKHYLKLGGKVLGFSVDEEFGHVVDGLLLVDLRQAPPAILERIMGKEGVEEFRSVLVQYR
ncbi:MAG: GNAT family N-acyltransferase [Candidatus Kapaibacterium sp.]